MTPESLVTSLPLSKRLKELGVPQKAYFSWVTDPSSPTILSPVRANGYEDFYSAFTAGELIQLLGERFGVLGRFKDGGFGAYVPNDIGESATGDNPADVLAALLEKTYEESEV